MCQPKSLWIAQLLQGMRLLGYLFTIARNFAIVQTMNGMKSKKKFQNMCSFYQVPVYFYGTKLELGAAMGKEFRASMAVTDQGLSDAIMKQLTLANGGSEYVKNESI